MTEARARWAQRGEAAVTVSATTVERSVAAERVQPSQRARLSSPLTLGARTGCGAPRLLICGSCIILCRFRDGSDKAHSINKVQTAPQSGRLRAPQAPRARRQDDERGCRSRRDRRRAVVDRRHGRRPRVERELEVPLRGRGVGVGANCRSGAALSRLNSPPVWRRQPVRRVGRSPRHRAPYDCGCTGRPGARGPARPTGCALTPPSPRPRGHLDDGTRARATGTRRRLGNHPRHRMGAGGRGRAPSGGAAAVRQLRPSRRPRPTRSLPDDAVGARRARRAWHHDDAAHRRGRGRAPRVGGAASRSRTLHDDRAVLDAEAELLIVAQQQHLGD